jgi:hypothetical protein
MRTQPILWSALVGLLATVSCSKGPEPPKPGSPAFLWNAARSTYHSGDFVKTNENLQQLVRMESEFQSRARIWSIVMAAGIAQGYAESADGYEAGARMNRANPMPFRRETSQLRTLASASALEFAEAMHVFMDNDKAGEVLLAFDYPTGSAAEPPSLRKISAGQLIQDSERESLVRAMVQRGVLLTASRAAGSADDPAKTLETLKAGEAKRPRGEFLAAMAKQLYERSEMFGPKKLDLPNRERMLCQEALEALQASSPQTKETKALLAKIQTSLKKIKGTT